LFALVRTSSLPVAVMQSRSRKPLGVGEAVLPLVLAALALPSPIAATMAVAPRDRLFDASWRFLRGDDRDGSLASKVSDTACAEPFCHSTYDDATWRPVELPHDWSSEDLPSRTEDAEAPVLVVRNGTWLFSPGDVAQWALPNVSDSNWTSVMVPSDWRDPPLNYTAQNAYGWYRRHISVTQAQVVAAAAGRLTLALGTVAAADETFVNGVKIGGTGHFGKPGCTDYLTTRAYTVPSGILLSGGDNVVAVRVFSQGGLGGPGKGFPGGLVDTQNPDKRDGPFDAAGSPGGKQTGYTIGGVGWYRKEFTLSDADAGKVVALRFDGVYMNSDVWCNGVHLGNRPYGYTTFQYDLTPHLAPTGQRNVIAVRAANTGKNSRWYSGSGIYRHVWLTVTPLVHVDLWGVSVVTTNVSTHSAKGVVVTTLRNDGTATAQATVSLRMRGPGGMAATEVVVAKVSVPGRGSVNVSQSSIISSPQLWSPSTPRLYVAEVMVESAGGADTVSETFGVRTFSFSADHGFVLNGVPLKLQGGCVHNDNGPLGSRTIDRAEERRVENLKAVGYNAIRTSHNPVSPAFIDACDRLGVLVMEEAFDCWNEGKNDDDYHLYFNEWWQRDIASMVLRDRNRPSIIMWSIGNEIPGRTSPTGLAIEKNLSDWVRVLDPTRAVTSAFPGVNDDADKFFTRLDVAGYNYGYSKYVSDHKRVPSRVMAGTESFPLSSFQNWDAIWDNPWVIGDFIWTAIDYHGESSIGATGAGTNPDLEACGGYCPEGWSYHISFCGDLDIVGHQKPQSFYRTVLWGASSIEIAVGTPAPVGHSQVIASWGWQDERQSWTWPGSEGQGLSVRVYSRHPAVQLLLNGKPVLTAPTNVSRETEFTATFIVPYVAGTLTAVGYDDAGRLATNVSLRTSGKPAALRLSADRPLINADRNDLSYVTVEVVDAQGELVPDATMRVNFQVSGVGELAAVGSGDPRDTSSFSVPRRTTWRGRCVAILRPGTDNVAPAGGSISLTATASGLTSATMKVTVHELGLSRLGDSQPQSLSYV